MNSAQPYLSLDPAGERVSMLCTNWRDTPGMAIVFWQGTIDSQKDLDTLRQAVATKLGKTDVLFDLSRVETLGSGPLAVTVCTIAFGRPVSDASRNPQTLAGILPGSANDAPHLSEGGSPTLLNDFAA